MRARRPTWIELTIAAGVFGAVAALHVLDRGQAAQRGGQASAARADVREVVREQLRVLRCAIERYRQDHGQPPGCQPGSVVDGLDPAEVLVAQLTRRTDAAGRFDLSGDQAGPYGPYLRDGWPAWASGGAGTIEFVTTDGLFRGDRPASAGWRYDCATGQIVAHLANGDVID